MTPLCLQIPEIVLLMCTELRNVDSLGSLASFAQTNSTICEAALDVLWEMQDSLVPFIRTLPQHEILEDNLTFRPLVHVQDYIPSVDWEHSLTYARRVRSLVFERSRSDLGNNDMGLTARTAQLLALRAGHSCLFPNIRELDFTTLDKPHRDYKLLRLFLGPSLNALTVCPHLDIEIMLILPTLPAMCPQVTDLVIEAYKPDSAEPPQLLRLPFEDAILGWHALTTLQVPDAHPAFLRQLGRCQSLRTLILCIDIDQHWAPASSPAFENGLSTLELYTSHPSFPASIIKAMSSAPIGITDLVVQVEEQEDGDHLSRPDEDSHRARQDNLNTIARMLGPPLTQLYYRESYQYHGTSELEPLAAETLLQFASFTEMQYFDLDSRFNVSDTDLAFLALAWPSLQYFSIAEPASRPFIRRRTPQPHTEITLQSLASFANSCPMLHHFACYLDATRIPIHPRSLSTTERDTCSQPLYIDILNSPIADATAVALFIYHVIGCSKTIDITGEDGPCANTWIDVRNELYQLQEEEDD